MIEIFEGRLGGGKTYSAVVRMLRHLARGGWVYSNVALDFPVCYEFCEKVYKKKIREEQIHILDMTQIAMFHKHIAAGNMDVPSLAVIDEAHLFFNARDWDKTAREVLAFLSQSRKVAVDVIFISQNALNMDKQFARLVQYYWRFRDMRKLVLPLLNIPYPFPHILSIQCDYDGKLVLQSKLVKLDKRVFGCYQTTALLRPMEFAGDAQAPLELESVTQRNFFDGWNWPVVAQWVILTAVLAFKIWHVSSL